MRRFIVALLGSYLSGQVNVYNRPADNIPSDNGIRIRSVSMNGNMVVLLLRTNGIGRWYNSGWRTYAKLSDLKTTQTCQCIYFLRREYGLPRTMVFCRWASIFRIIQTFRRLPRGKAIAFPSPTVTPRNVFGAAEKIFRLIWSHQLSL